MKLTIIADDKMVIVDGRALQIDLSGFPAGIHAVQWDGTKGHIERPGQGNEAITNTATFSTWISRWMAKADEIDNTPVAIPPCPQVVSIFQGCAALQAGGYLDPVEAYMTGPASAVEKLAWRTITEIRRTSPLTAKLAVMLGLTETQVDDLFILAATIEA